MPKETIASFTDCKSYSPSRNVTLLGFGNNLWKGVKEMVDEKGFVGIFLGGFKNCAGGLSAALVFSYLASLIAQPKMKKH